MRFWRVSILAIVLFLISAPAAFAQQCNLFDLEPSNVTPGETVEVFFRGNLTNNDAVLIDMNGSRYFTLDCAETGNCEGRSSITSIDTTGMSPNTSVQVNIAHLNALGNRCDVVKTISVIPEEAEVEYCSPAGLVTVSPQSGDESDTFRFTGCLGLYSPATVPGLAFQNVGGPGGLEERQLAASDIQDDGSFSITQSQFAFGVWTAQLYTNQSPQGAAIEFTVNTADSVCTTSEVCTVDGIQGSRECEGVSRNGGQCEYDASSCGECLYCGDNRCSAGETAQSCPADCTPDAECGNLQCEFGETPQSCPSDCKRTGEEEDDEENIDNFNYCQQVPDGDQRDNCLTCVGQGESGDFVYTAVGCLRTGGTGLTEDLIRLLLGVSGGVALLSILAGAFLFTTSQGDSSKLKEAKGLITAAVTGLFFIIFSIFVLQFLGVSILRIPGLSGASGGSGAPSQTPNTGGEENPENTEPAEGELEVTPWTASDVQWQVRQLEDRNYIEVCVQYPSADADQHCVEVLGSAYMGSTNFAPFEWALSPPESAQDVLFQCGSLQVASYARDFAQSQYQNWSGSAPGFEVVGSAPAVLSSGPWDYRVLMPMASLSSLTEEQRTTVFNFADIMNTAGGLQIQVLADDQNIHEIRVPFELRQG